MDYETFHEIFPNYTHDMYDGNAPCGKGHEMVDGGFSDRWEFRFGNAETYKGEILYASFALSPKVNIFVSSNSLWVLDKRYSNKSDFWEFCVNHSGMPGYPCFSERCRHTLEHDKLISILSMKIENCKIWDMISKKAKELCHES